MMPALSDGTPCDAYVTLHGTIAAIRDHVGKQARISIDHHDTWTHFALSEHPGAVRIHTVKRIVE